MCNIRPLAKEEVLTPVSPYPKNLFVAFFAGVFLKADVQ